MLLHHRERSRFFLPTIVSRESEVSPAAISSWLCHVVYAYESADDEANQLYSWALLNNLKVEDVMKAALWRSHTTSTSQYLWDLTRHSDSFYSLGLL